MGILNRAGAAATAVLIAIGCSPDQEAMPEWLPDQRVAGPLRLEVSQPVDPPSSRNQLRVMTYNTLFGFEADQLAAYILAHPDLQGADLLLLQEAEAEPGTGSDAAQLAVELGMGHVYAPAQETDDGTRGLAILSRFPIHDIEVMYLDDPTDLDAAIPTAIAIVIDTPRARLRVVNVHLDVALGIVDRVLQLRPAVLDQPEHVVVGGDLNTNDYVWAGGIVPILPIDAVADTSQAEAIDDYMRGLAYDTPTTSLGPTWHAAVIEDQRLDHIFTRGLKTGRRGVDRSLDQSDHWPVWLDIAVR